MSEATCSERECMLALAASSDEIKKYPMVQSSLVPFAGPQCYAHLDPGSPDYRVDVAQEAKGGSASGNVDEGLGGEICEESWLQCDRCKRWRFVEKNALPALRGERFFEDRDTDLDWVGWLDATADRYRRAKAWNAKFGSASWNLEDCDARGCESADARGASGTLGSGSV